MALSVKIARLKDEPGAEVSETDMQAAIGMMRYFIQSLEKFKTEQGEMTSKKSMIREIFKDNPAAKQTEVARMLGVSQPYVSRITNKL